MANIAEALTSLDDIGRADPLPFLYIRIRARLNSTQFSPKQYCLLEKIGFFISRPIIAISFLLFIFFLDGLAIQSTFTNHPKKSENSGEEFFRSNYDSVESLFYSLPENEDISIY